MGAQMLGMQALGVDLSNIPAQWQHPSDASVVLAHDESQLGLAREFNARALVLRDGKAESLDRTELETAMNRLDTFMRPVNFGIERDEWHELEGLLGSIGISKAIAAHMQSRIDALHAHVLPDMGKHPKKLHVALFGRHATPRWHTDSVGPLLVETLVGPGTRWVTPFGQFLYQHMPAEKLGGIGLKPYIRQGQTGDALLFNHHNEDGSADCLRYRRLVHASPNNPDGWQERFAYAIHFNR